MQQTQLSLHLTGLHERALANAISEDDFKRFVATAAMNYNRDNKGANNRILVTLDDPIQVLVASGIMLASSGKQLTLVYEHATHNIRVKDLIYFNINRLISIEPV